MVQAYILFLLSASVALPSARGTLLMYPAPSLRLNEAANVSIICKGNGSALSWYGPTGAIVNSTRTSIYSVSTNNSITSNLFIASLCITDSGNYTCTNGVERVSASIFVLVYPRIGYTPQVQTFTEGQQACVICTVERGNARDEPTLEYLRSPATSPVPALNSTMCLCIPHVTLGDAGLYQYIVGVNDVGTFNRSIQVNVLPATQPDKKVLELLNTAISIDILIIHGADWDQSRAPQLTRYVQQYVAQNLSSEATVTSINLQYLIELADPQRNAARRQHTSP